MSLNRLAWRISALGICIARSTFAQEPAPTDSTRRDSAQAPVTITTRAAAHTMGSVRRTIDSTSFADGARPRTLSELLQARIPGVSVVRYGGDPSDGSRIRIRGTTSLSADGAPVVVVDGMVVPTPERFGSSFSLVPGSRFDDFEVEEIERVDVLSGPAATALFGVGASRGAIVVTTKRGRAGTPRWSTWASGAMSSETTTYPTNYLERGTSTTTGAVVDCNVVAASNRQCTPTTLLSWNPLENASPFRSGSSGAAGASLSGGPVGIASYASITGRMDNGVLDDSRASRLNGRLNLEREFFGRLLVGARGGYVGRNATIHGDDIVARGLLGEAVDDVNRGYLAVPPGPNVNRRGNRFTRSAHLDWRALGWLRVRGVTGRDELTQRDNALADFGGGAELLLNGAWSGVSLTEVSAEATARAGSTLELRTIVGYQDSRSMVHVGDTSIVAGSAISVAESFARGALRSWVAQERVAFRERLFVNLGARWIEGERFDGGGRWHPSVDASWLLPGFTDRASFRLRGAYAVGVMGRDTAGYSFLPLASDLTPVEREMPREIEVGVDGTIGGRFSFDATLFSETTPDLLMIVPLPPSTGFGFGIALGEVANRGLELTARTRLLETTGLRWDATATLATLRNRIDARGQPPRFFNGAGVRDGQPFGTFLTPRITYIDTNGDNLPGSAEVTIGEYRPNGTAVPTREASVRTAVELRNAGLVLSAALDHRGGHRALNMFDWYQCRIRTSCLDANDPTAPLVDRINAVAVIAHRINSAYNESASYTRLGELALQWRPGFGGLARGLRLTLEARNLATWSRFGGPDPEVSIATAGEGIQQLPALPAVPRTVALRVDFAASRQAATR